MCILNSVGNQAKNDRDDVKTIQLLLNLNGARIANFQLLSEDGAIGKSTSTAIEDFQKQVVNSSNPDGRVDPNGATLNALKAGIPAGFSADALRGIMLNASAANLQKYTGMLDTNMTRNQITTPLRKAHFLAQVGHESGELRYCEEIASGDAYEGRADLGNTEPGDGKRFKGRGLIQLTGRANYKKYGDDRGKDYVSGENPKLIATDANLAVDVACWFWLKHALNEIADKDDIVRITKIINGGTNGLDDRQRLLARAKFFLIR